MPPSLTTGTITRGWTPAAQTTGAAWLVALAINMALFVATVVGGVLAGSLALLADAGHLASDVGAIAVGLVAARLAGVAPTPARTYGLQRSEVLGALANGVLLLVVSVLIVVEALTRLGEPPDVDGAGVLALGVVGLAGNAGRDVGAGRGRTGGHQSGGRAAALRRRRAQLARASSWPVRSS